MIRTAAAIAATCIVVPATVAVWIIARSSADFDRRLDQACDAMRRQVDDDWAETSECIRRINHPTTVRNY